LTAEATTGLPAPLELLYQALPDGEFNKKDADAICVKLNLPARRFETAIRQKQFSSQFKLLGHGKYIKV
jgi:hypothetical protein